jgi:DNA-binding response OmpR family regulator
VPHILIAADADWVVDDVRSALEDSETSFTVCRSGQEVVPAAIERLPDLAVLDLQVGNMGGMAICMSLHLDESSGRVGHVKVLMLLDRDADVHLARRSGAEGWLVRPLDPLRLRRAATTILDGGTYFEGQVPPAPAETSAAPAEDAEADAATADAEPPRGDEVPAG